MNRGEHTARVIDLCLVRVGACCGEVGEKWNKFTALPAPVSPTQTDIHNWAQYTYDHNHLELYSP
jgi:hypothetical protein